MASLCSKAAGLGALSAFCVASSRSSLFGPAFDWSCNKADVHRRKWARVGGLKEESRTQSVFADGGAFGGAWGRVRRICITCGDEAKALREDWIVQRSGISCDKCGLWFGEDMV